MAPFIPTKPTTLSPRHMGAPTRQSRPDCLTVGPGQTLWDLVAEELGTAATDWEIAREWPRWHAHNLSRIGEDPSTLRAGTVLRLPPPPREN